MQIVMGSISRLPAETRACSSTWHVLSLDIIRYSDPHSGYFPWIDIKGITFKVLGYMTIETVKLWKVFWSCVGLEPVLFLLGVIIFRVWLITFNHMYKGRNNLCNTQQIYKKVSSYFESLLLGHHFFFTSGLGSGFYSHGPLKTEKKKDSFTINSI